MWPRLFPESIARSKGSLWLYPLLRKPTTWRFCFHSNRNPKRSRAKGFDTVLAQKMEPFENSKRISAWPRDLEKLGGTHFEYGYGPAAHVSGR
jgi:hypothetical protein